MTGHHERSGGCGYQHQSAHAGRVSYGELLREPAAPGNAQDVGLLVAELVEQTAQQWRQRPQMVGPDRRRGPTDARQVEPDDFPLRVERVDERLQQFKAGADAVAQQQWRPSGFPGPYSDPQDPPAPELQCPYVLAGGDALRSLGHSGQCARQSVVPRFPGCGLVSGHRSMSLARQ